MPPISKDKPSARKCSLKIAKVKNGRFWFFFTSQWNLKWWNWPLEFDLGGAISLFSWNCTKVVHFSKLGCFWSGGICIGIWHFPSEKCMSAFLFWPGLWHIFGSCRRIVEVLLKGVLCLGIRIMRSFGQELFSVAPEGDVNISRDPSAALVVASSPQEEGP